MNTEFVEFLCKWQTLLGAAIGGIIGLLSALIVAHSVRRRDEVSAAMVLVANLVKVVAAFQTLLSKSESESVDTDTYHRWLSEKLAKFRPSLSPMFEASVARIMPVSGKLASHLELFCIIYSDVEIILERISDDYESFSNTGVAPRSQEKMDADANMVKIGFETAVQHAICAEHLLSTLILSNTPTFNRMRMFLCKTKKERNCNDLLREGTPNKALQSDCLHAARSCNR